MDNRFLPTVPGRQLTLTGTVVNDGSSHRHQVVTTVTDLTKVMDGVRTIVVYDVDLQDGQLQEAELFFLAQRDEGSVWTLGEYPEVYQDGTLIGAPDTWIAGIRQALAGQAMLANPAVGTPTYLQGLSPTIGFKDCATVVQTGQRTCVPAGCFDHVLLTDEFAPGDPAGGHQRKSYAPGVGNVRVAAAGGDARESLQLTSAKVLCPGPLDAVRAMVLAQDARGYHVSPDVYAKTPPAERTLHAHPC